MEIYKDYYQYEEIVSIERKTVQRIPEDAFREAVANALIHRTWDIDSQIRIAMFDDYVEVMSPGGLPDGISEEDFRAGKYSKLRNPIIANVFYRLGLIEMLGTGIVRIMKSYSNSTKKPAFDVSQSVIKITLPVITKNPPLTADEQKIYKSLSKTFSKSMSEIVKSVDFGKSKANNLLKEMNEKGIVVMEGNGRGTKYHL